jgi:hypothetical protein
MKNKLFLMITISAFGIFLAGCSASFSTGNNTAAVKPANTSASPAAKSNSNSASTAKNDEPKTVVKDEKKPEGTAKTAKKDVPVPADWVYFYDNKKGYGFSIPEGTTSETDDSNGVDFTNLTTPSGIDIFTLVYKDKTLTKKDLLEDAVAFLEGLGQKVTPGALKAESDDYAVADATTVLEDGRKGKLRILVGTDVTDNYVMILGTDTDKFASNEKIIDQIWGSFEMWSGGASGN